jgi:hypothetical protein
MGAATEAAKAAGEVTANWLGTTAANVGKSYNESVVKRLEYLTVTVDKISSKTKDKKKKYTIDLTIDNAAPDNEKLYVDLLLYDNYLVACDKKDYTYMLSTYDGEYDENEEREYDYSNNMIVPGKSRITVYTVVAETEEINRLLFLGKEVSLP